MLLKMKRNLLQSNLNLLVWKSCLVETEVLFFSVNTYHLLKLQIILDFSDGCSVEVVFHGIIFLRFNWSRDFSDSSDDICELQPEL